MLARITNRDIGFALYAAQLDEISPKAKPLHGLGGGVIEIAASDESGRYRAVYSVEIRFTWSRHAFQTKSKAGIATPSFEIELVRQLLKYLRSETNNAEKKTFEQEPSSGNVFADLGLPTPPNT